METLILQELRQVGEVSKGFRAKGQLSFDFLVDSLAVPGPRTEFTFRFATLASAIENLHEQGKIAMSGNTLNPTISLK